MPFDAEYNKTHKRKYNKYDMRGKYAKIILSDGQRCIIDKEDVDILKQFYWSYNRHNKHVNGNVENKTIQIARYIMMSRGYCLSANDVVDHIDRNPLNNIKKNLRVCDRRTNAFNKGCQTNNKTGYPGVSFHKTKHQYQAYIKIDGRHIYLGFYDNLEDAIKARKNAENKYDIFKIRSK